MNPVRFPLVALVSAAVAITANQSMMSPQGAPNGTPIGVDDAFEIVQDTRLAVDAPGLLANDSDPDGDPILNGFHSNPANGTILAMAQDGSFTYEPDAGFVGVDTFQYSVQDDQGNFTGLDPVVTITVIANRPPVGVDDVFEVVQDTTLPVAVPGLLANDSDPDGDPIVVGGATQPANGTMSISAAGSFQYTPDPGFSGVDSFLYAVEDDEGNSTGLVVDVVITVTGPPGPTTTDTPDDPTTTEAAPDDPTTTDPAPDETTTTDAADDPTVPGDPTTTDTPNVTFPGVDPVEPPESGPDQTESTEPTPLGSVGSDSGEADPSAAGLTTTTVLAGSLPETGSDSLALIVVLAAALAGAGGLVVSLTARDHRRGRP